MIDKGQAVAVILRAWCLLIWVMLAATCFYYVWRTPHPNDLPFCAAALYFGDQAIEAFGALVKEYRR